MNKRAEELIQKLDLEPHPEGGFYKQIYKSKQMVTRAASGVKRPAVTTIYYLLCSSQHSRWHMVKSDEIWHFYEGDSLTLHIISPDLEIYREEKLAEFREKEASAPIVPAGYWQAAVSDGEFSLVGCTVSPGFEFADFRLLSEKRKTMKQLLKLYPEAKALV